MDAYPSVGEVVAGRYRIDALLGEGGMGAVFRASDASGNAFALKFPAPEIRSRPGMMSRFANEAAAAARIASEHVVRIHGVEATEGGVPFMVMELLDGTDLDRIIEQQAPVDIPRAVHFALQILRALQVAHAAGVVHRDMKPSNCFVLRTPDEAEFVKLIDFGITKILGDDTQKLTATSVTMGTPAYMAPEQARSAKAAEPRSDLYAVGVILYELLTKRRPYEGDSHNELVVKICTEPPLPLRQVRPDLPPGLAAAVERALVKIPASRWASAAAFADALKPFADARSARILERIERGVDAASAIAPPLPPAQPSGGSTAVMVGGPGGGPPPFEAVPPTVRPDAHASEGRVPQRTVVAEGPLQFAESAPVASAPPITPMAAPLPTPPPAYDHGPPRRRSSNGPLLAVLSVLAVGLIGTGVYFGVIHRGSAAAPTTPAAAPAADDEEVEEDDGSGTKKKKKKKTKDPKEPQAPEAPEPPPPDPIAPVPGTPGKGKVPPKPSTSASAPPSATTPPTTSGTTTAPTLLIPPGWGFPTASGPATAPPPATTAPPPATTAPPPATTAPPPPPATTTAPPATTIAPGVPKPPKIGGG